MSNKRTNTRFEGTGMLILIDAKAASGMLGLGARRLWSLTNCGAIPSRKIGRSVRYAPHELHAWVAAGCPTDVDSGDKIRKGVIR